MHSDSGKNTICHDCGIDAWNQVEDGLVVHEDFYVSNEVWDRHVPDDDIRTFPNGVRDGHFVLCIGCFERRVGRELVRADLAAEPKDLFGMPPSRRFMARWSVAEKS